MFHNAADLITIREGAIFVADAHYPHHDKGFEQLLEAILNGRIEPSQLFLMGDIFDLLFGYNAMILNYNKQGVKLLRKVAQKVPTIYLEGNHDFCLKGIFPNITIYPYRKQPVYANYANQTVALAHGDRYEVDRSYRIYTALLRNPLTLRLLKPWQKQIINPRLEKLKRKSICATIKGFRKKAHKILRHYPDADIVIEGHFHQGVYVDRYVSLPSFACSGQIAIAKKGKIAFLYPDRI